MENYKPFCAVCQAMLLPAACFRQYIQIACLPFGQITSDTKQQKAVAHSVTASAFSFYKPEPGAPGSGGVSYSRYASGFSIHAPLATMPPSPEFLTSSSSVGRL